MVDEETINDNVNPVFTYGRKTGPYYNEITPETEFDTEQEAIEWAYEQNSYATWLILPIVKFENH